MCLRVSLNLAYVFSMIRVRIVAGMEAFGLCPQCLLRTEHNILLGYVFGNH